MAINQGAVQVSVTINGGSITINKENFLNLKIKRYIGDSANTFTLEAFDETAYALENLLMKNQNFAPIMVQYCSAKNMNKKITFSGVCYNYQISFVGKGTLISITGVFSGGDLGSTKYWFEKANIEWCGSTPEYDEVNQEWVIDGKGTKTKLEGGTRDEVYTDITNENVCAILKFEDNVTTTTENNVGGSIEINSSNYNSTSNSLFTNIGLSEDCNYLASRVKTQCQANGISNMYPVVMAIMMQESGGHYKTYPDVFQCSESLGKKPNSITLDESLKQGPKYFSQCLSAANNNIEVAIQAYNFGLGFALWAARAHPGQSFSILWIKTWKSIYGKSSNYGDENYVEHVKRYYKVSENATSGDSSESDSGSTISTDIRLVGGPDDHPTVYYNPSRIFKRIMNTYSGAYAGSKDYANYFKIAKVEDTQWVAGLDVNQSNETAAEYINRVLTKNAMTVSKDELGNSNYGANYSLQSTGYKYYVNAEGHNFEHIDFAASAANAPTLTYGSKDSIIISFSTGNVGAIAMTGSIYDDNTGQPNVDTAVLDDISGDVFTLGGERVLGADVSEESKEKAKEYKNWYSFQISPNNIESSSSSSAFEKRVYDTWYNLKNLTTTAEMTVWGESGVKLSPGGFVNIIVYGQGMQHYSSGCYYITSMEDNISADGYTQTCKLIKNLSNLKVTETNKTVTNAQIKGGNTWDKYNITWETTTSYSNGESITSYTPGTALEEQYLADRFLLKVGNTAAKQKAEERLKSKEYDAISEAKKQILNQYEV